MRKLSTDRRSTSHQPSGVEILEARIAPAAVAAPGTFSYTDSDGDTVQVQIFGTGSVEFLDANGADVSTSSLDIAKVVISTPNTAFALVFSDTNALGNNTISLGQISGPANARLPVIKGIFTADSSVGVTYELDGFIGTGFTAGGGLNILGPLTGDDISATRDLDLVQIPVATKVHFRDGITGGANATVTRSVAGTFQTGDVAGDLTIGTLTGLLQTGHISGTATITGNVSGRVYLNLSPDTEPTLDEVLTIGGAVSSRAFITGQQDVVLSVAKTFSGHVNVAGGLQLTVAGTTTGASVNADDNITLTLTGAVARSSFVAGEDILVGSQLRAGVTSSEFLGGDGTDLQIFGNVRSSRFSGGVSDLNVTISGSTFSSQFVAGGDSTIVVGFSVDNSSFLSDGRLELTIGRLPSDGVTGLGNVTRSLMGSKATSAAVTIGGRVSGSEFTAGTDLTVTVGGTLDSNVIQSGNNLTVDAFVDLLRSRLVAGSDALVMVDGQVSGSAMLISNNLDAQIGYDSVPIVLRRVPPAGLVGSRLETSDGNINVTVTGPVASTIFESGQSATVTVRDLLGLDSVTNEAKVVRPASVAANVFISTAETATLLSSSATSVGARISAGDDVVVDVIGFYNGSISSASDVTLSAGSARFANDLSVPVSGAYGAGAVPPPAVTGSTAVLPSTPGSGNSVKIVARGGLRVGGDLTMNIGGAFASPLVEVAGNVLDFSVGGAFSTRMYVGGNFSAGTPTASANVIGGVVSPSTILHIGGNLGADNSSNNFIFAAGFAGKIEVGGDMAVDLTFNGSVNRIEVDGVFAPMTGNAVAEIVVQGKLRALAIASPFTRTGTNGGNFTNELGVNTGLVNASGGAPLVGIFA